MRTTRTLLALLAGLALALGLVAAPAPAAAPSAKTQGTRIVVSFPGKQPTKASIRVAGARYTLTKKGAVWRTKSLPADVLAAARGAQGRIKARIKGKNRSYSATIPGATAPPTPVNPGPGPQPLFAAPGVDREGPTAYDAIKGYFANSTLSDCPDSRGWPYCQVEERYGIFEDGTQWYCYLTPNSGSDVKSVSTIQQVLYAQQKADGAWRVDYQSNSYGNTVYYSVNVAANGSAVVNYWAAGANTAGPPTNTYSGLRWFRGAKDCSY